MNQLAENLATTRATRQALMARLFQVQEDERRAIARDLHDEFGQCLTATAALAAIIERSAGEHSPEIAMDAARIAQVQKRMMLSLRSTLKRLRSQNIEEIGLEASLRQLIIEHTDQARLGTVFRLEFSGQLASLPTHVATDVYRIAQECITNAVKHGKPTEVHLRLERYQTDADVIELTVEDDGAGNVTSIERAAGYGILGIKERLEPYGGSLTLSQRARGMRVAAVIPLEPDAAAARAALGLKPGPVIALLPGSRRSEVKRHARLMLDAAQLILRRHPDAQFVLPAAGTAVAALIEQARAGRALPLTVLAGQSHTALAACDVALVASGTATLETMLFKKPMVITYRVPALTAHLMRKKALLPWIGLPNILARDFVVPERVQEDATPEHLAADALAWLADAPRRAAIAERFRALHATLRQNAAVRIAEALAPYLAQRA